MLDDPNFIRALEGVAKAIEEAIPPLAVEPGVLFLVTADIQDENDDYRDRLRDAASQMGFSRFRNVAGIEPWPEDQTAVWVIAAEAF